MSTPLVTIGDETDLGEIARLLAAHRMKRLPVIRDGRIVGIVSRADLLRAFVVEREVLAVGQEDGFLATAFAELDGQFLHRSRPTIPNEALAPPDRPSEDGLSVSDFQVLLSDFEQKKREKHEAIRQAAVEQRQQRVAAMIDRHVSDDAWRSLLHQAREAAEHGQKQLMLLQLPERISAAMAVAPSKP